VFHFRSETSCEEASWVYKPYKNGGKYKCVTVFQIRPLQHLIHFDIHLTYRLTGWKLTINLYTAFQGVPDLLSTKLMNSADITLHAVIHFTFFYFYIYIYGKMFQTNIGYNKFLILHNFSLHQHVQNGSGAHPASYPMGTRGSFPGGEAAGA
jgi:hypothetical protein